MLETGAAEGIHTHKYKKHEVKLLNTVSIHNNSNSRESVMEVKTRALE